jgi:prepilin-type N-terminal cleavage/methylation domain-containing protein/prepilin-type processing-associated H-X9-DG protein
MRKEHHSAFTLIELLVVITIIAILIALLFPVIAKSRSSARSVECKNNMKQIGTVMIQYRTDNDGKLPASGFFGIPPYYNRDLRNFQNQIRGYLGLSESSTWSTSIDLMEFSPTFKCPSYKGKKGGKNYELRGEFTNDDGIKIRPFGLIGGANGAISVQPMFYGSVQSKEWALKDDVSWENVAPNHDTYRNALFFDGRVGTMDLSGKKL